MSALIEFAIFPTDKGESKSKYVAKVIEMIKNSGVDYQFTPMGTIIETKSVEEGLEIVKRAYEILEIDCNRIYSTIKIDYRKGYKNRLTQKIKSVESKLKS
ncbi:MAG: MTH1187 family thiamine-binding protein [Epsilonproteobacteria bacterium]|nr:MTH1187 family thiamine-binding protein [Campylobacterota bacterium]